MSDAAIPLPKATAERLHQLGLAFLAEFLEIEARLHPGNVAALSELGHVYTRLGRSAEGLEIDRRLVAMAPGNPTVHYNLACSLALLGNVQEALDALETSVGLGFCDAEHLVEDEDLQGLHSEQRFVQIVDRLRKTSK